MKIVVLGGTGFVGSHLVASLAGRGDDVVVSSRSPKRAAAKVPEGVATCGESEKELRACVAGADAVVNLAGASLFSRRWTEEYKREIRASRVETTARLVGVLRELPEEQRPKVLVNASAVGYYGDRGDERATEATAAGRGFLPEVCVEWESAAEMARSAGVRVVLARFGVILGADGGALEQMETPFKLFVGGPVGNGRQWVSWVHLADAIALLERALSDDALDGPVNVVAPEPVRFARFARAVARAMNRPSWLPVPGFALRVVFGEVAGTLLDSTRVEPAKALEAGFTFRFPTVEEACEDLLGAPAA